MKRFLNHLAIMLVGVIPAFAGVSIDEQALGEKLGGWTKRSNQAAEYPLSGSTYRTYKPEISPTPDGGIFVSLRIDHVRGWLSSDDHAMLEIVFSGKGQIVSAQSSIAIQGRAITSDLIKSTPEAGKGLGGVDHAVQVGTDLVADLSAKLLREKIVEAGRVSFPAVVRHNYNLLFQAIKTDTSPAVAASPEGGVAQTTGPANATPGPETPATKPEEAKAADAKPAEAKPAENKPAETKLEIKPYGDAPKPPEIPAAKN